MKAVVVLLLLAPLLGACDFLDGLDRLQGPRQHHPLKVEPVKPQPVKPLHCGKGCDDFLRTGK